jgi:hypothetical protein
MLVGRRNVLVGASIARVGAVVGASILAGTGSTEAVSGSKFIGKNIYIHSPWAYLITNCIFHEEVNDPPAPADC